MKETILDVVTVLLEEVASSLGRSGGWVERIEHYLSLPSSNELPFDSNEGAEKAGFLIGITLPKLAEFLLFHAVRMEELNPNSVDPFVERDALLHLLLISYANTPSPRKAPNVGGEQWTIKQLQDARFYRWRDYPAWANYFLSELEKINLPTAIVRPIENLFDAFVPSLEEMTHVSEDDMGNIFLDHFWRGDRFVEFHEWAQWVINYDHWSIPGLGPARTRVFKKAIRLYLQNLKTTMEAKEKALKEIPLFRTIKNV